MKSLKEGLFKRTFFLSALTTSLAVGVTWAIVSSQTTLAANTISSATASLQMRSTNRSWSSSAPGFTMKNLIPGTGVTENIYFKNDGKVGLQLTAHMVNRPPLIGFTGWNNVLISFTGDSCGTTVDTTMAALLSNAPVTLPCGTLAAGAKGNPKVADSVGNYSLHFDLNQATITGSHAGVGVFNIQFSGTQ